MSQHYDSIFQERSWGDSCSCHYAGIADQIAMSPTHTHIATGSTSSSIDPLTPGISQGSH